VPAVPLAAYSPHLAEFMPPLIAAAVYLGLYRKRTATLSRTGRPVPRWRAACFVAGTLLLVAVQVGPLDELADEVLAAHMVQHIVIGDICSLLIVLGLTGPVLQPLLHIRLTRPLRTLANPLIALLLWALNLYVWHLPLLYQLAINHDLVHALEHACLLWFGTLLWLGLIGPLPKPAWFTGWGEVGYVFAVRLIGAVLANALLWAQTVFYPVYRSSDAARGLSPVSDQNVAGAVMMVEQIVLTLLLFVWVFMRFATRDEERQELLDLAAAHGIPLSEERAARAARSGTAARLRARLLETAARAAPDDEPAAPLPDEESAVSGGTADGPGSRTAGRAAPGG
jgi:cytochrome c oxidase assembly factor CtaG